MQLLQKLCSMHAPSGDEFLLEQFLLDYIDNNKQNWKQQPQLFSGDEFKNSIVLVFGRPNVAFFAHIDSVGFYVKYENELVCAGSPSFMPTENLRGFENGEPVECELVYDDENRLLTYNGGRFFKRGTTLSYAPRFKETDTYVESPFLDDRVGVWLLLKLCETIENGMLIFTCNEESHGGSVELLTKFIFEKFGIVNTIIADVTPVSNGILHDKGVVISLRDYYIPPQKYVQRIISYAEQLKMFYQVEVEDTGASDGAVIHKQPYPVNWCFIGPPVDNMHTSYEVIHKFDIFATLNFYKELIEFF